MTLRARRLAALVPLALVALVALARRSDGFVALRLRGSGTYLRCDASRFPLAFQVHDKTANGSVRNVAPGSDVLEAIRAALDAWQEIPTSSARFAEPRVVATDSSNPDDGVSLITMANTPVNVALTGGATGTLALTRVIYDPTTGKISESDIVFNPSYPFSTGPASDTYDLQAILTHELGHALGCDHDPAANDTMFHAVGRETFFARRLSTGAAAYASFAYPERNRPVAAGVLSGSVTQGGRGVFGASIAAVDLRRNRIATTLSEADGSYQITGLAAGDYVVSVEPLDGPATADTLLQGDAGYYRGLNVSFPTALKGAAVDPRSGGGRASASFVLAEGPATLNVSRLGRGDANLQEGTVASRPVVAAPGETFALLLGGPDTWKLAAATDVWVLGAGVAIDPSRAPRVLRNAAGAEAGVAVVARVSPDAAPGPRSIHLRVGDQVVTATGGIVISERRPPATTLHVPYFVDSPDLYTGVALANPSPLPAVVHLTARDASGLLIYEQEAVVPASLSLPAAGQKALLGRQIFELSSGKRTSGSLTIESDATNLQAFFLTGDVAGSFLDGATPFTRGYRKLVFVDVLQNRLTATDIHLMNTTGSAVDVELALVGRDGRALAGPVARTLPSRGGLGEPVAQLFGYSGDLASAHVTASAPVDALAGFGYIRQGAAVFGLDALPVESARGVLYSPHLAVGDFGVPYRTRLALVNAGTSSAEISLTVSDDAGRALAGPLPGGTLEPGAQLSLDAGAFFGLAGPVQGSVEVVGSAGARLLGGVLFGDGDPVREALGFGAALPLAAAGSSSFSFSQIAQAQGFYTGVALFAPHGAEVTVDAYRADGTLAGSARRTLDAGARSVELLEGLIPATHDQSGGHVRVTSSRPVIGFEIFGATDGRFLTAVAPQPDR